MFVVQWKCNRWVNCTDSKGKTIYFNTIDEAKAYANSGNRIAEWIGGNKYKEIEIIK